MTNDIEHEIHALLNEGHPQSALRALEPMMSTPPEIDDEIWPKVWGLFSEIMRSAGFDDVAALGEQVQKNSDDAQSLYDLGFQLVEIGLPHLGTAPLLRCHRLMPELPNVLTELVHTLEVQGRNGEAVETIKASGLDSFHLRYLTAFNAVMDGDIETAMIDLWPSRGDEDELYMAARISRFIERSRLFSDLGPTALRQWQYVTTGSVLTHVSVHGFEEGMTGRYAFVQDSHANCRQGIDLLRRYLDSRGLNPSAVKPLADRGSQILGAAVSKVLGLPLSDSGDLVVAYDLAHATDDEIVAFHTKRPGQVVFAHAVNWRQPPPYAPDVHTLQYQFVVAPWEPQQLVDGESEADTRPPEIIGQQIAETEWQDEGSDGYDAFLVDAAKDQTTAAERERFWDVSPVKSSYFS